MTFDGSPKDTRRGVGGFPEVTQPPSRTRLSPVLLFLAVVLPAAIVIAVALFAVTLSG